MREGQLPSSRSRRMRFTSVTTERSRSASWVSLSRSMRIPTASSSAPASAQASLRPYGVGWDSPVRRIHYHAPLTGTWPDSLKALRELERQQLIVRSSVHVDRANATVTATYHITSADRRLARSSSPGGV